MIISSSLPSTLERFEKEKNVIKDIALSIDYSYSIIDIMKSKKSLRLQAGLMHMTKIKISPIRKYIQFLQEGFPLKLREIHILNAPYFVDKVMEIVKIFMKSELLKLVSMVRSSLQKIKILSML